MNLAPRELFLAQQGLSFLIQELNNQVATCPDPAHYAQALVAIDRELEQVENLFLAIRKELGLDD